MKKTDKHDEELQKHLFDRSSDNILNALDKEEGYYFAIKQALESGPEISLPKDFASMVATKAIRRKQVKNLVKSVAMYLAAACLLGLLGGIALYFLTDDLYTLLVKEFLSYKYPILFGLVMLLFIQIFDEILVKKRYRGNT